MRSFLIPCILLWSVLGIAQNASISFTRVDYQTLENGKLAGLRPVTVLFRDNVAYLSQSDSKIESFTDFNAKENIIRMQHEGEFYKTTTPFDSLDKPTYLKDEKTILDYPCKHAVYHSFSNTIDIWFTEKAKIKGSPYPQFLPTKNSLVLRVVINGSREYIAKSIVETNEARPAYDAAIGTKISTAELEELKIKSRYTKLSIFNHERINFDPEIKTPVLSEGKTGITYRASNGTVILKKITLPAMVSEGAYIHARLINHSNGDAYDRTGSVFLLPNNSNLSMLDALENGIDTLPLFTDKGQNKYQGIISDENYNCPIEIMRFFTSFGVRHFNTLRPIHNYPWADSVIYNQEITAMMPTNEEEIWVGVFIGNYDKNGHTVSLDFNFYPSFEDPKKQERWVQPLFSTLNIMEMSGQNYGKLFRTDTLRLSFEIPENMTDVNLMYTSTGHGGWGNGDEFNPKLNQIRIDGEAFYAVVPWRTDCATYRFSNPASGNFGNGLSSSDLSRSNWCPATLTPPYLIPLNQLKPGKHQMEIIIDQGKDEGQSFSHWCVSGVLTGNLK